MSAARFQSEVIAAPAVPDAGGQSGPALVLLGNALVGLLLAMTAAGVLLARMRPPLEEELAKRSAAVCRATAGDLQYAATVSDATMAQHRLEQLATEPSARVDGAWLVADGSPLSHWLRPGTAVGPELAASQHLGHRFVQIQDSRYSLITCPVEALQNPGLVTGGPSYGNGRLTLLIDTHEIAATARRSLIGALGLLSLAISIAIALQFFIARFVIARLTETVRRLRETQARLVRADKLAAVGTLSAGVAHEINNPLAYVIANLEYLKQAFAAEACVPPGGVAEIQEVTAEALQGAHRIRVIVRDLKALARGDEEKVKPLDVREVAESAINIAMNEIKHRGKLVRDFGEVALVEANDVRLGQVFLNLLVNAAHALPEGGTNRNEIRVRTRQGTDGRVAVEIEDTGCGIPKENMSKLFDPFFTTKAVGTGTGLGLWVCHGMVSSLGGEIAVESQVGVGTTIRVLLPAARRAVLPDAEPAKLVALPPSRILVVDDEPNVGRSIQRLFAAHQVTAYTRAQDALDALDRGERFDAILSDVMMPTMTGIELFEEIQRRHPALAERVIFITGGAFTPGAAAFLQRIPNARLDKPFDERKLQEAVSAVLRRAPAPAAAVSAA